MRALWRRFRSAWRWQRKPIIYQTFVPPRNSAMTPPGCKFECWAYNPFDHSIVVEVRKT